MDTKQVIVMRKDLNMRKGKMIAQGAHAAMAFLTRKYDDIPNMEMGIATPFTPVEIEWLTNSFTKVCVYVESEEELSDIVHNAGMYGLTYVVIRDNGRTEFDGVPTVTCVAIGPDYCDKIDKVTGHLPLL